LAPLEGANRLTGLVEKKKKPDGDANGENLIKPLATTPDGTPLLLAHVWNGSRVMAFGADTTYQWYLNGQQDAHQRFWRQLILYLSGKKTGDEPVWVNIDQGGKRHFGSKDDIPLRFGARDKDQKPRPHLYFHVRILGPPSKKKPQDRFSRELEVGGGKDGIAEYAIKLDPFPISGEYWIRVDAYADKEAFRIKDGSKSVGGAWERFLIQSPDVEMSNTTPDPDTLKMISRNTGGTFIKKPQDLKAFLERLAVPEDRLQGTRPISLWDTWPLPHIPGLLLLFVLLLTTEWFIRKRRGLV
ncbi:MAG: hypothetical protein IID45_09595, partial [Planctomycetes bacterium]|nr:hypothetical protein [Planctomycetota bacterium]